MGARGAPFGNQNSAKAKRWTAAIERALARKGLEAQKGLDLLADKFVEDLLISNKDSMPGWREFGDRMEGKPVQQVEANVTGNLTHVLEALPVVTAAAIANEQRDE